MSKPEYNPSPEEIRKRCAETQEGWDERHKLNRIADDATRNALRGWQVPTVKITEARGNGFFSNLN